MASKQLGKLRQWAGEVISSRDKTTISEEFRELEKDIELRKDGVHRLQVASEAYHHVLVKKKDLGVVDPSVKLLPLEALGMVMIFHGEEFPDDSAFGNSLVKFGRAHCKIATMHEAYAVNLHDTFMASVEKFTLEIKDYEALRKKLESRRLSFDAAMTKLEKLKSGKKEKDKKDAEDEVLKAKLRYEETAEDVRARMHAIQENEIDQLRELTAFLDLEMNFVGQYLEVLKNLRSDWPDNSKTRKFGTSRVEEPLHVFSRATPEFKSNSVRSRASTRSNRSNVDETSSSEESSGERMSQKGSTRRLSSAGRKSKATPRSSRPSSRTSGKRSDGTPTSGGGLEKEREKERGERTGRRLSVAGWASTAVGSVTGLGKKNKDNFAALIGSGEKGESDGESEEFPSASTSQSFPSFTSKKTDKKKSKESLGHPSPKPSARILKPLSLQDKKCVRALHDFTGTSDELSFKAGDEIVVINEVLDEWWMGELDGRKGLFPTSYTETITSSASDDAQEYGESDIEDDHLFRADHLTPAQSQFYGHSDVASITSSAAEDEGEIQITVDAPRSQSRSDTGFFTSSTPPLTRQILTDNTPPHSSSLGKKPPPPPPPRRLTTNGSANSPVIPDRRPSALRSVSSPAGPVLTPSSSSTSSNQDYDTSPFESATDFIRTGCNDFRQNPFKPKGMCSNCFTSHL